MAYGNIVGYQPGPQPGAYAFQKADGGKFVAFGAPAEDLKARVDASQQQLAAVQSNPDITPQAVAQNAPPVATALPASYEAEAQDNLNSAFDSTPLPAGSGQPLPAEAPAQVASEANMSVAPTANAPGASPNQAAPVQSATQQPSAVRGGEGTPLFRDPKTKEVVYLEPGGDPKNPANLYTKTPATPVVRAGFSPHSMKVTGGSPTTTGADLEALRENSIDQKLAYQQSYDLHAESAAEQRGALDAQQQAIAISAREAQQRQQQMQAQTDDMSTKYEQAKTDYSNSSIDPDRYMKNSPGGGWLNALGMALGAAGATLTKSPNFAQQFVQQQIQNDIRSQEATIKIKGDRQQTALGDLQRQLGSLDLARTAYQGVMLNESKRRLEVLANHQQSRDMAAQYLQGAAQLDQALQANDEAFRKQAAGNVETEYRYRQASGGSAGGRNPVTMEQARTAYAVTPKTHVSAKSQEGKFAVEDSKAALHEAAAAVGLRWDPAKQEMVGDAQTLAGSEQWSTEGLIKARQILGANAGTIAEAAGERKPPVGQIKDWVHDKLPGGADTAENYKQFLSGAMRNAERKGRHAVVETNEPEPAEREEPTE